MTSRRWAPWVAVLAVLVLVSGSAYAAKSLGRNTVGSKQIKNGSVTSQDVKDGTLQRKDLKRGAVPRVYSYADTIPADGVQRKVIDIPGFSRFLFTCTATDHSIFVGFGPSAPIPPGTLRQQHGISASDIVDSSPIGASTVTALAGGVGFGNPGGAPPGSGIITQGDYFGRSATMLAHGRFWLSFPSSGGCLTRVQVTVQELAKPDPLPMRIAGRGAGGADGCVVPDVVGNAAFCEVTRP